MMRTAMSNKVVCANCGERFTAPAHSGRYRQTSERRIKSARYCTRACRQAAYVARRAIRAGIPHSERHKAFRHRRTAVGTRVAAVETRVTDGEGTTLHTSVTLALQPTEISSEILTKKAALGAVSIVPDCKWAGMYRLRFSDGSLTDMVNLTRAKDALARLGEKTQISPPTDTELVSDDAVESATTASELESVRWGCLRRRMRRSTRLKRH
jgi:hypothetical protein